MLGDFCRFRAGGPFPQSEQGNKSGEVPFIKVSDLSKNGNSPAIVNANNWLHGDQLERLRPVLAPAGSVVFAKIGEGLKAERLRRLSRDTAIDNNLMVAVPNEERVVPGFLFYYLQTVGISNLAVGSALPYLKQSDLSDLPCQLPSLGVQAAIADVLGALDDKIAANTQLATTADELAGALLRSHVDPTARTTLTDIAEVIMGSSPTGETLNEEGEGVPFFQGVRDFGFRFPARRVWTTSPTRFAEEADVLVSVRAPVGSINVASERLCVGRGLAAVRARDGRQATLLHLLRHVPDVWLPFEAEGTVFGSINRAQLHALDLPVVPRDVAGSLESEISALESRIRFAVVENQKLAATRDALLPALMSGKLRVEGAAEVAGL
ncbi:restriction endonuclease subunit S [Isoptericola jiangsuensis]|uniref:restriction endonuclease subunit S n=1 Tax=Isoptericola jiangsuensis TaxID=548579 RepID=UPI001FEB1A6B|nr:restriction endonuclease subunit S [Isoptericola jiangsuensis]